MPTWNDVERLCERLPDAALGEAHEGSPAWYAGRHQFARLRCDDDGQELAQLWSGDMDTGAALGQRPQVFPVIHTHRFRVSFWTLLAGVGERELAELVLDSYVIRSGVRRGERVDRAAYFAGLGAH